MDGTERSVSMPLGVVVERRDLDNRWQRWSWRPVALIPGAAACDAWKELQRGERFVRWHAATLQLELHRKETLAYKTMLANARPVVYVVLRQADDAASEHGIRVVRATASPFEAQDYLDSGEDIVEGVPMPEAMVAWVQAFVDRHHVDEPFRKRRRERHDPDAVGFGRRPEVARRGRHGT